MDINKYIKYMKLVLVFTFLLIVFKFLIVTNYYYEGYSNLAANQTDVIIKNPLPRGEVYDINDNLVVGNKQSKNLIYMSTSDIDSDYEWEIAEDLADNITVGKMSYNFQKVDYKDLIINENYSEITSRVDKNYDKYADKEGNIKDFNQAMRAEVTQEDYDKLKQKHSEKAIKIKILMNNSSTSSPQILFEDLNIDEQYYIKTNYNKLGGCFMIDSWERYYPYGEVMRNFLGTVGDIPEEEQKKYENLGYSTNDKVGTSYLEEAQEEYLKSTPQEIQVFFDSEGNVVDYEVTYEGKVGMDIKLTIDIELQKEIEKILKDNLKEDKYKYFKTSYTSIMDVNTGNIIAMAGIYDDDDKNLVYDNSIGSFSTAYEIGSIVKPVILLTGYKEGVWEYGQVVNDMPMNIGGGITKASYNNYGEIDEYGAIGHSSNVYFYTMALKIAGIEYGKDPLPATIDEKYFNILRNNYAQFGLGAKTGIDLEGEIEGVKSNANGVGLYMDMANGQYDTYTPLQATQYISTLANGESRYRANYLYSINEPGDLGELGKEVTRIKPIVLNHLNYSKQDMEHVQDTMIKPSQSGGTYFGTAYNIADSRYKFGSKTGTSESFYYEEGMKEAVKTNNTSFMAYAPYDDPNIALSVVMPYWTSAGDTYKTSATEIGGKVLDACYDAGYIK